MGIANMRAGQKINHQRISVQLHPLDGRSKKAAINSIENYLYKKDLPGVTERYYPHISNTFSLPAMPK
jgi:hypothetical protein